MLKTAVLGESAKVGTGILWYTLEYTRISIYFNFDMWIYEYIASISKSGTCMCICLSKNEWYLNIKYL